MDCLIAIPFLNLIFNLFFNLTFGEIMKKFICPLILVLAALITSCSTSFQTARTEKFPDLEGKKIGIVENYNAASLPEFKSFVSNNSNYISEAIKTHNPSMVVELSQILPSNEISELTKTGNEFNLDYLLLPTYYLYSDYSDFLLVTRKKETANIEIQVLDVKTGKIVSRVIGSYCISRSFGMYFEIGTLGAIVTIPPSSRSYSETSLSFLLFLGGISAELVNYMANSPSKAKEAFQVCIYRTLKKKGSEIVENEETYEDDDEYLLEELEE